MQLSLGITRDVVQLEESVEACDGTVDLSKTAVEPSHLVQKIHLELMVFGLFGKLLTTPKSALSGSCPALVLDISTSLPREHGGNGSEPPEHTLVRA